MLTRACSSILSKHLGQYTAALVLSVQGPKCRVQKGFHSNKQGSAGRMSVFDKAPSTGSLQKGDFGSVAARVLV